MIICPTADNLLTSATVLTDAKAFERGLPAANFVTTDPRQIARWRGLTTVTAGVNDDIDGPASAWTATVAAGSYYSAAEFCIPIKTALEAADPGIWGCYALQGDTNRGRIVLTASSSRALPIGTGTNTATNLLWLLGGFRKEDRAGATTHTGDFASLAGNHNAITYDLGSDQLAEFGAIVAPHASAGLRAQIQIGSTSTPAGEAYPFTDFDRDVMFVRYGTVDRERYVRFDLYDERREDEPRIGAGYLYHGPGFDTDRVEWPDGVNFDRRTYTRTHVNRSQLSRSKTGQAHVSSVAPGEEFGVEFSGDPGTSPADVPALEDLFTRLGISGYAIVCIDPTDEINRETRYCRFVSSPVLSKEITESPDGRWHVSLNFQVLRG